MLIYANDKKLMTYIFPERGKIGMAQFILDRSGLVLKTCKILMQTASLDCKMLRFFSLSFPEAAHACSFHTKNFEVLTEFSDSVAEKLSICKMLRPYNSQLSHNGKNTDFCILIRGPMPCWTRVCLILPSLVSLVFVFTGFVFVFISSLLLKYSPFVHQHDG